jgi:hypothetical protein
MTTTKMRDVPIVRRQVELSGGHTVEVRGINASDLILLTTMFGPQVAMAYAHFKKESSKGPMTEAALMNIIMAVMNEAPKFLGWIIAIANDDPMPETADQIAQFPAIDQAVLLNEIVDQTFSNEATVKKLTESLSAIYLTISGAMMAKTSQNKSSPNGIGASVVQ